MALLVLQPVPDHRDQRLVLSHALAEGVAAWRDQTPKDFLFAWKASKFITHWKRLSENCANSIELMETRLKALAPKVGAVLFQLPPQFSKNRERLASFLGMLPRCYPYAFEPQIDELCPLLARRRLPIALSAGD